MIKANEIAGMLRWYGEGGGYRFAYGALATRVKAGVAAILTSTSLTGCSVQACVT